MVFRKRAQSGARQRLELKLSPKIRKFIDESWKVKTYLDEKGRVCNFESRNAFVEYVFAILLSQGENGWKMLSKQKLMPWFI